MGILDAVRRLVTPQPGIAAIGTTEPVCPHCSSPFPKMPARKTRCPSCQTFVFSRTRPSDRRKVLLREEDLELLEEQWSIVYGTHDDFVNQRQRRLSAREALRQQFGTAPSEFDITWRLLNEDLVAHGSAWQWGLYRNTRVAMGELLRAEGRLPEALVAYLEVCYLDLNGPRNAEGLKAFPDSAAEFPPFDPKRASLAPGILDRCRKLARKLELPLVDLRKSFQTNGERLHRDLRLPVDPEAAWRRFETELST